MFNNPLVPRGRSLPKCSVKKVFLKILQNSQKNMCARISFLIKLQSETCNFIKKGTLAQVFSCGFCEIFKNTFFTENLRAMQPRGTKGLLNINCLR